MVVTKTVTDLGNGQYLEVYTGTGSTTWTPQGTGLITSMEILIVGGGGSSGGCGTNIDGGAGGAGGVLYGTLTTIPTSATIVVGAGGTAPAGYTSGNNGGDSSFGSYIAYGGGGGGTARAVGKTGGSGGGAGGSSSSTSYGTATQTSQSPLTGYGYRGGGSSSAYAGGGGGATGVGITGFGGSGGTTGSGPGFTCSITGSAIVYAKGGQRSSAAGTNGLGNGGDIYPSSGHSGCAGGSGTVIVKYTILYDPLKIYITPTTGTDPLTVSYAISIRNPLTNFTLSYGDGSEYTTPDTINTIFEKTRNAYTAGFPGCTFRSVLSAVDISSIGTVVRFKMVGPNNGTFIISHASIVERDGSTANGTTIPTEVTFNDGESGFTLDAGTSNYIYSDWITYTIDETKDYLFIVDISLASTAGNAQGFSGTGYYKSGGATSWNTQNLESPNLYSFGQLCFKIETRTPTPQSSFSTTHVYSEPGTYTVWAEGYNEFATHLYYEIPYGVTVNAEPLTTSFSHSDTYNRIEFTDLTTGSPNEWYWDFGDGTVSYVQNPTHIYYSIGTYTVNLYSSNQYNYGIYSATVSVDIIATIPKISFTPFYYYRSIGHLPISVQFNCNYTPNIPTTFAWDFGGYGQTSTEQNPLISFATYGSYTVSLTGTNIIGSKTVTYSPCISIVMKQKELVETLHMGDSRATFPFQVCTETIHVATVVAPLMVLTENLYMSECKKAIESGVDEFGIQYISDRLNILGQFIYNSLTSFGRKILHTIEYGNTEGIAQFPIIELEETLKIEHNVEYTDWPT